MASRGTASGSPHVVVVGGGIVGLAAAYQALRRFPSLRLTVLEKEPAVAEHQSRRNSGVLHTGIYYRPGSAKAITCTSGKRLMEAFCASEGINFRITGKLIVATTPEELARLKVLSDRAAANAVICEMLDGPAAIRTVERHAS